MTQCACLCPKGNAIHLPPPLELSDSQVRHFVFKKTICGFKVGLQFLETRPNPCISVDLTDSRFFPLISKTNRMYASLSY